MSAVMQNPETKKVQVHIPYPLLLERLEDVLSLNINPEIYIDGEYLDADPGDLKEIRKRFTEQGLTITLHGPYAGLNPGSADEDKRIYTAERYRQAFRVASYLRPKTIVLHAGYSERTFKGDFDLWLSQGMKTWPEFVQEAARINTTIAAENIFEKKPDSLKRLVESINSANFRLCIDTGHLNIFSAVEMEEWFKELGPYIAEVHLHDNRGSVDDHLPLGEGSIDFKTLFGALKAYAKDPVYTIEPHGEDVLKRAIKAVKRFL